MRCHVRHLDCPDCPVRPEQPRMLVRESLRPFWSVPRSLCILGTACQSKHLLQMLMTAHLRLPLRLTISVYCRAAATVVQQHWRDHHKCRIAAAVKVQACIRCLLAMHRLRRMQCAVITLQVMLTIDGWLCSASN